jgi:hypothetical protein
VDELPADRRDPRPDDLEAGRMTASICGPICGTPLFLHVLGAIVLFGGVASVAVLASTALREKAHTVMLQRAAFTTTLLLVWPAFIAMRVGGQWVASDEHLDKSPPGWVGVGFAVSDAGILILAAITLLAWLAPRRPKAGKFLVALSVLYVIALGVAWFAMSAKPGA